MVQCCNSHCPVQWFHYDCIGIDETDAVEDWWCSDACEASGNYIYCSCHRSTPENSEMVQCELADGCRKYEWYHPSCLCVTTTQLPGTCNISLNT